MSPSPLRGVGHPVGVLTGVTTEADCLRGIDAVVVCSGADAARAEAKAAELVAGGAAALVSFGLAGGLAEGLAPGTLLLPDAVRCADGTIFPVDPAWRDAVCAGLGTMPVYRGAIAASDRVVATPAGKRALARATGADAVDMESGAVARAAQAAGLPFLVLRAVADPADRALPSAALAGVAPDGAVRPLAVALRLLASPWQLPALLALARDSRAGLSALAEAVLRLGSLAPPHHLTPFPPAKRDVP